MGRKQDKSDKIDIGSLSREEELELFTAIRNGDAQLKELLIKSAMTAVSEAAGRCVSSEVSFNELFVAGCEALTEAVSAFDCSGNEQFSAYLSRCLQESMQSCYERLSWFLPVDYSVIQLHDRYELALLELYPNSEDREDEAVHDEEYVAEYLGVTREELRAMKNEYSKCRVISLSESVKLDKSLPDDYEDGDIDNRSPLVELIVDPATENGAADYLDDLMDCLSEDERYIVCARDGVLSAKERTDGQIARDLGIEEGQVELSYRKAIEKMRKAGTGMK